MRVTICTVLMMVSALSEVPAQKVKQPKDPQAIAFEYFQSQIFLKVKINSHRAFFTFLFNTGANTTVIDKKVAGILKLPVINDNDSVEGTTGKERISICKLDQLIVGNVVKKKMNVAIRNLDDFGRQGGLKIDGILGTDFLKNFIVTIDFKKNTISFANKLVPDKRKFIPFEMKEGRMSFYARLNDTFDTRLHYNSAVCMPASRSVYLNVSYPQWCDIKRTCPFMNHVGYMDGKGVGGAVYLQVVKIREAVLDTIRIPNAYVVIQPQEGYFKREDAIGFFGNNLLEKYNKVTLDFQNSRLVFGDVKRQPLSKPRKVNVFSRLAKN